MHRRARQLFLLVVVVVLAVGTARAQSSAQRTFASPEEAADALAAAVRAQDVNGLLAVVGPGASSWLFSGDRVADRNDWSRFLTAYEARHAVETQPDGRRVLVVGEDAWPFPAPLVERAGRWRFDAEAGREELLDRRVGRNELDTLQTLLAIVDAQREYARSDVDGDGLIDYARRIRSTPGQHDGLYWEAGSGERQSPLGPLVARATREGYGRQAEDPEPSAFHGYLFRLLTAQGPHAPGGAHDYLVGDALLGGFAVVAYPARYGLSGVTTFLVNHEGVVYQKDLGPETAALARGLATFDPDPTWKKVE